MKHEELSLRKFAERELGRHKSLTDVVIPAVVTAGLIGIGIAAIESQGTPENASITAITKPENPCTTNAAEPVQELCKKLGILKIRAKQKP